MITVDYINNTLRLNFKYYKYTIDRIKSLGGLFDPSTKTWSLTIDKLQAFKRMFKGEVYYRTPLWEIEGTKPPDYSSLYKFDTKFDMSELSLKMTPYKYQEFGIKFLVDRLVKNNMVFLADGVGLGKTLSSIGAMKYFFDNGLIKDVVVVCKKSIKTQWKKEIERAIDFDGDIYVIGNETKSKRDKVYKEIRSNPNKTITIVNYHILINDADNFKNDFVVYKPHCTL